METITIATDLHIPLSELSFSAIRAGGPGGQHVNKSSTAVQLRFDISASSLPQEIKQRLLSRSDQRISSDGILTIRSQQSRSQEQNKRIAISIFTGLIAASLKKTTKRRPTKPGKNAIARRLDNKKLRSQVKQQRGKVRY